MELLPCLVIEVPKQVNVAIQMPEVVLIHTVKVLEVVRKVVTIH